MTTPAKTAPEAPKTDAPIKGHDQTAIDQNAAALDQMNGASRPKGDVTLVKAGEAVKLEAKDLGADPLVTVEKDVVLEFYPAGTKRPSHILLYHAGQQVQKSALEAYADKGATAGLAAADTRTAGQ